MISGMPVSPVPGTFMARARAAAVVVSLLGAVPVEAQPAGRLFTHEDMIAARRLGAVAASPDGTRAVLQVLTYSYDRPGPDGDLWIVDIIPDAEGREPRRQGSVPGQPPCRR